MAEERIVYCDRCEHKIEKDRTIIKVQTYPEVESKVYNGSWGTVFTDGVVLNNEKYYDLCSKCNKDWEYFLKKGKGWWKS